MTEEEPVKSKGLWGWAVAAVIVALMVYPLARWMTGGGQAVTQPAPGAGALQLSFQEYQAGRYQEAVTAAKAALAADPNSADAYNNLAVSYLQLRMYDEGIQAAQTAIRIKPDLQLAKNNLAWIEREKANASGAVSPPSAANTLLTQSLQHYQAGRFKECMDAATQSAKLNPNSAPAFNNAGICASRLQLWDEATESLLEALRLNPDFQLAKNNLASVQQQKALQAGKPK